MKHITVIKRSEKAILSIHCPISSSYARNLLILIFHGKIKLQYTLVHEIVYTSTSFKHIQVISIQTKEKEEEEEEGNKFTPTPKKNIFDLEEDLH